MKTASGPARFLDGAVAADAFAVPGDLWGFGGLHGGLVAAILAAKSAALVPGGVLEAINATFLRPIRRAFEVDAVVARAGSVVTATTATAAVRGVAHVVAATTFSFRTGEVRVPRVGQPSPPSGAPGQHARFHVPPELAPFAQHVEIRPVGDNLPFLAGTDPTLTAWIRLLDDDRPVDSLRLVVLLDALAPSITAVLSEIATVPTIELSVHLTGASPRSEWVLVRASTHATSPGGLIDERLDAWDEDGAHLASARQLRAFKSPGAHP